LATPAFIIIDKSLIKAFFIWISISLIIRVKILRSDKIKEIQIDKNSTILELIQILDFKPDTIIVLRDEIPIPIDETITEDQELTIIQVSSGG
jgi:sulfur carrier protein ThiS